MSVYKYEDDIVPVTKGHKVGPSPNPTPLYSTAPEGYIGCYADSATGGIMVKYATQDDMTAEVRAWRNRLF